MTNATPEQIQAFNNNPLIKRISQIPQWTISDNNKHPLNIQSAIDTDFRYPKFFSYDRQGNLAPLADFDNKVPASLTNRAIRLNTEKLHIFALDIEPEYNHDQWNQWLRWLPYDYAEFSTHNGIHMLVNIPDDVYNISEFKNYVNHRTDVQFLEEEKSHQGIEFVFNRHFMTLTRRVIIDPQDMPFESYPPRNDADRSKRIAQFILKVIKPADDKAHSDLNINRDILAKIDDTTKQQAAILKTYITKDEIDHAKQTAVAKAKNPEGGLDLSRLEWRFFSSIYGYYRQITKNAAYLTSLEQQLRISNVKELTKVINSDTVTAVTMAMIGQETLRPRPKWNTKRQGIPWLLSNCFKVIKYFTEKDNAKKKK